MFVVVDRDCSKISIRFSYNFCLNIFIMLHLQYKYLYFCLVLSCKRCSRSRSQVLNPTQPHTARSLLSLSASSRWQLGVGSGEMQNLLLLLCRSVTRLKPAFIVKGIPWKAYFTCAVHRFCNRSKDVKSIPPP